MADTWDIEDTRDNPTPECAQTVTIYDFEYRLLEEVSRYEQNNACSTPYASQYPSSCHDALVTMTLAEVREHQARRMQQNPTYQAVGRYQFIYDTLAQVVNDSGTSWDAIFDQDTQDWLAVYYMRSVGLNTWLEGNYTNAASDNNDVAFMIRLARIWAAIPVPITVPRGTFGSYPVATRSPGDSFYEGSINSAGDKNPANFLRDLRSIRRSGRGAGNEVCIPLVADPNRPRETGNTNVPGRTPGNGNYVSSNRLPGGNVFIPYGACLGSTEVDPYQYKPLHQLDNRYDFRIGDKVRDLLENGQTSIPDVDASLPGYSREAPGIGATAPGDLGDGLRGGDTSEPERNADGNLVPNPGESISEFVTRLQEDDPALDYSDYTDRDIEDVLSGRPPRQWNPNTGEFEYPLVSQSDSD